MDKQESPFNITIDRKVIKLLGAHLYGDTPSVINELIANAHDAKASNVWISVKTTSPYQISVEDDGIGMTLDEINKYYLNIGYNRREEVELQAELRDFDNENADPDMGQKGIGKLAVFALSKKVKLVSKKNASVVGCFMDFDIICQKDGQPEAFNPEEKVFTDFFSRVESGTMVLLENVVKDLSKSYKYIASNIARSFFLNDEKIHVHMRKDDEKYKEIKRSDLNYYDYIDVFATIGENGERIEKIKNNKIEDEYKKIFSYEELVAETASSTSEKKKFDALPKRIKVFDKAKTNQIDFDFSFSGWIGTVKDEGCFKSILAVNGYTDDEIQDKNIIIVDDNRISIYSRGKIGEYNVLPKLKTKAANDAYIIGEIFVDDFEDDKCIDMATSSRRGYQEDDNRYITLCRNLKLLVSRVVWTKQSINKKRQDDTDAKTSQEIKDSFEKGHIKSKEVFNNMSPEDLEAIEEDHMQFSRAVSLDYHNDKPTRILISHRQDELRVFGDYIINVFLRINKDLGARIVFTSNPEYGLPKGKNIFDELKKCFRPDYYVVFLFTKSFYDSNPCLAEAGAAWATNRQYMSFVVDVSFSNIDKPLDNSLNGAKFVLNTDDEKKEFALALVSILDIVDSHYEIETILKAMNDELSSHKYSFNLPSYTPRRLFQAVPRCQNCGRPMQLKEKSGKMEYVCDCSKYKKMKAIIK